MLALILSLLGHPIALLLGVLGLGGGGIGVAAFLGGGPWMLEAAAAIWARVWKWLSHATFLQVACIIIAIAFTVDHLALLEAHRENGKLQTQLASAISARDNYKHQLDALSTKKNEQAVVTTQTVTKVVQGQVQIRTIVQHVHDAPNPPNCATPDLTELSNAV